MDRRALGMQALPEDRPSWGSLTEQGRPPSRLLISSMTAPGRQSPRGGCSMAPTRSWPPWPPRAPQPSSWT